MGANKVPKKHLVLRESSVRRGVEFPFEEVIEVTRSFSNVLTFVPSARGHRFDIYTKDFVGVLQVNDWKITILPKGGWVALFPLLAKIRYWPEIEGDSTTAYQVRKGFLETVAGCFLEMLKPLLRRGWAEVFHKEANFTPTVRGRIQWNLPSYRRTPPSFCCEYPYRTKNLPPNQLIKKALQALSFFPELEQDFSSQIDRLLEDLEEVGELTLPPEEVNAPFQRPEYRPVLNLARLIVAGTSPYCLSVDSTSSPPLPAFLLSLSRIFQDYVTAILSEKLEPMAYWVKPEPRFLLSSEEKSLEIKPDLVLYDEAPIGVVEVKYKYGDNLPAPEDFYQVVTYATMMNIQEAFLVYPGRRSPLCFSLTPHLRVHLLFGPLSGSPSQIEEEWKALGDYIENQISKFVTG